MKLSAVERATLKNQQAIMTALAAPTSDTRRALRLRMDATSELLAATKLKRLRKLPRNTGPFSGDVGDQGYRPLRK